MRCAQSRLFYYELVALFLISFAATGPLTDDAPARVEAALAQPAPAQEVADRASDLRVHEWGTFTSIAGKDGVAVEWRPLSARSDLPGFVYSIDRENKDAGFRHGRNCLKCDYEATVRMETPVLYFYADRETSVSAKVDFPKGAITEWYPQARAVGGGVDWGRLTVLPGAEVSLPVESHESHYYPARETDAAPLRVCSKGRTQYEKFLFYRGVGTFDLPLSARLEGDKVLLKNSGREEISHVYLFENRGGQVGFSALDRVKGETSLDRPALDQTIESLESELEASLISQGLYGREAKAMIETWRGSWFEEGTRIFYILPRKLTDTVLPIIIDPKPAELVRVMVGRTEIITPEIESAVRARVARALSDTAGARDEAKEIAREYGRFSGPILKRLLEQSSDRATRSRIERLIAYVSSGSD